MSAPKRIQRKRTKGWRMPEGAVYVGRPTVYGNPFRAEWRGWHWVVVDNNGVEYEPLNDRSRFSALEKAVVLFEDDLLVWLGGRIENEPGLREAIERLRGRDLVCWCSPDEPCHADSLLRLANGGAS
ncbi:MAG TPA: DUF4326 domain-containing protein [Promicromonospora sp.]|nr:DUF4326 domain-containing protein [Promicromonospora sp.]